jgi:energy-coupling factor transporter ATP-binding protein EcfA2
MKLLRLHVTNFAAVREVDIEFGPGLNVLYGPNDLGKSTLVDAIRVALLLPHASSACDQYVRWTGGSDPVVELTFQTEEQRIWRVRKEFGKSGSSLLQESRNGEDFEDRERGRKVDGRLREIRQWGIPEPGGSAGSKGIPRSFLATALLSIQADVTAMLRDSLQNDPAASGKDRIAAALEAVAQDPLFIALLRSAQERRDEAFTDKGARKQARGSVFKVAADRVRVARDEREKLQRVVAESESTERLLQGLNNKRTEKQDVLAGATDRVSTLERLATQAAERASAAEQVRLAQEEVDRIRRTGTDVEDGEKKVAELLGKEHEARRELGAAQDFRNDATAALKSAEEAARAEGSDSGVSNTVVRQELELRIAGADQAAKGAQERIDAAASARGFVEAAVASAHQYGEQQETARLAEELFSQTAEKEKSISHDLLRYDLIERALELRLAERRAAEAQLVVDKLAGLQSALAASITTRRELAERRAIILVPTTPSLASMRRLANDLAAARGALNVGLLVTVTPNSPVDISLRKDGQPSENVSTNDQFQVEASTEVDLEIGTVASIKIRGGGKAVREAVLSLEERWNREVAPHLETAGVTDLDGLEAKAVQAQELDAGLRERDVEVESLRTQVEQFKTSADALRQASEQVESCRGALGGVPIETLSKDVERLGQDPIAALRKRRQQLAKLLESARVNSSDASKEHTLAEERLRNLQALLDEAVSKRDLALASFPKGVDAALTSAQRDRAAAAMQGQEARSALASLDQTLNARNAHIEEAVRGARAKAEAAETAVGSAQERLEIAMTNHAAEVGRLNELRRLRDAEDLSAGEAVHRQRSDRYAALPVPDRNVTADEVSIAKNLERALKSELESIERDVQRAHGALQQVGGSVARERLRDATEAFELATRQEKEIEADYEAWRLLLEQMKEAEAAQSSNLGQTLAPVIAGRFQALTARRYETVRLTVNLGTEGVVVDGAVRSPERMSVGTREQSTCKQL